MCDEVSRGQLLVKLGLGQVLLNRSLVFDGEVPGVAGTEDVGDDSFEEQELDCEE